MEDNVKESGKGRTYGMWPWEQIGRTISLLPDGGSLPIGRREGRWEVECRTGKGLLLKAGAKGPGSHLGYMEGLLRTLEGLEGGT